MENNEKSKSKIIETITQSNLENDATESLTEQDVNMKIVVKSYQEPARSYFSSPCLLSEMENAEDLFNF